MKKFAILSVSDKTGIAEFAESLVNFGYEIIATGNTAKVIREKGIECKDVSDLTGIPEIFEGRVKTLHPKIFGGILFRRDNVQDKSEATENGIEPVDIVCVNLYPFPEVVKKDVSLQEKIENIDIGGPSLIRAAAKNYKFVSVLTNPAQYDSFLNELNSGEVSLKTREKLAYEAFAHTSFYDTVIADFFEREFNLEPSAFRLNLPFEKKLRYGENPHQEGALFGNFSDYFEQLHGKELSFNNIADLTAAVETLNEFKNTACVIVKHMNPCGSAVAEDVLTAYTNALACDPVSAFGGIAVFNREVNAVTAEKLNEIFLEIVTAPSFAPDALEILKKKKNRRILLIKKELPSSGKDVKAVPGGVLVQEKDNSKIEQLEFRTVTNRKCTEKELKDLKFAWAVCKHTKSNAIVVAKDQMGIGVGAGQMSRVDAAEIAVNKAHANGHSLQGAVAASDAFFPFPDGIETLAEQGITAVIQPGGSIRDEQVIEAANKFNIAMIFTGIRNFKH